MDETEIRQRIIEFQNVGRTVSLFTAFPDICCCYACAYLCKCIPDWLMGVPHQWKISSIPHHKPVVYYRQTPPESERGKDSHWRVGTNRVFRCRAVASLHLLSIRSNFRQQRGLKKNAQTNTLTEWLTLLCQATSSSRRVLLLKHSLGTNPFDFKRPSRERWERERKSKPFKGVQLNLIGVEN